MLWHAEENLEITEEKGKHCGISIQSEVALESDSTAEIPYVRIKQWRRARIPGWHIIQEKTWN